MIKVMSRYNKGEPLEILFSDEDADLAAMWWRIDRTGYPARNFWANGAHHAKMAHRVVLARMFKDLTPDMIGDHINRNKCDARRENLRIVTIGQNHQNQSLSSHNTSGYRGVSYVKSCKKWRGLVTLNRQKYYCGNHETVESAAQATAAMRKRLGFLGEP